MLFRIRQGAAAVAFGCTIEETELRFPVLGQWLLAWRNDANHFSGREPIDLIAWMDIVLSAMILGMATRYFDVIFAMTTSFILAGKGDRLKTPAGMVLIVVGLVIIIWGAFGFKAPVKILDAGPIHVTKDTTHHVPYAPIAGAIVLIGGVILIVSDRR